LMEAQRIGHVGSWEWDITANKVDYSDEICRIFGVKFEGHGTYEDLAKFCHPDDEECMTEALESALRDRRPYDIEYRIVRPDGVVRWLHTQGQISFNEDGKPIRMVGLTGDITERKELEATKEQLIDAALHESIRRREIETVRDESVSAATDKLRSSLVSAKNSVELALSELESMSRRIPKVPSSNKDDEHPPNDT